MSLWQIIAALLAGIGFVGIAALAHAWWFWRTLDASGDEHIHHD